VTAGSINKAVRLEQRGRPAEQATEKPNMEVVPIGPRHLGMCWLDRARRCRRHFLCARRTKTESRQQKPCAADRSHNRTHCTDLMRRLRVDAVFGRARPPREPLSCKSDNRVQRSHERPHGRSPKRWRTLRLSGLRRRMSCRGEWEPRGGPARERLTPRSSVDEDAG
jgi:hypothetical protein